MTNAHYASTETTLQIPWDGAKMRLGRGYAADECQAVQSPFENYTAVGQDADPDVKYEYLMISNEEELQREISSFLSASASVLDIGIKTAFEQLQRLKCNSRAMTAVLRCTITHDPTNYGAPPLFSQSAEALLDSDPGYEFKGHLSVGKGIASVKGAARHQELAKKHNIQRSVSRQTTGIAPSSLKIGPETEDIETIFKQYAAFKPKPQIALLEALFSHRSPVFAHVCGSPRIGGDQGGSPGGFAHPE
ncbi:uncharacterized protein BDZ99DRAFT_517031 [Mytilinidion resinicola]|uniref:Uncharacterized protein n=1 Tax=Mytilinidion resinicola TaxID=574789 RepID=A0A6A6Z0A9_9PEZI|nr:uncharacterized protein BDZ99DRAFT_517031 [Mytilinidion resinicola]KAF2814440.1 hypothetical protein BDZ99DRAFT_517031 [Mytilinidion resinicola]